MAKGSLALVSFFLLASVAPASGQRVEERGPVAVGLSLSTLGLGPELSLHLSPEFRLRGGLFYFDTRFEDEVDGVRYKFLPKWVNVSALADLHPTGSAFRLTAGLVLWNTSADAKGRLTGPVEIGDRIYQPSEVGSLFGTADYTRSIAPLFALGFAGRGRFAVTFDLGIVVSGHPRVMLDVDSPLTGTALAQLRADVAKEEASIQQDIDDEAWAKLYPVLAVGFRLRF